MTIEERPPVGTESPPVGTPIAVWYVPGKQWCPALVIEHTFGMPLSPGFVDALVFGPDGEGLTYKRLPRFSQDWQDAFSWAFPFEIASHKNEDFVNSLGFTVPLASQLGVEIGTLGSMYTLLTNLGNSAQEAAQMIASLLNSTSARKVMNETDAAFAVARYVWDHPNAHISVCTPYGIVSRVIPIINKVMSDSRLAWAQSFRLTRHIVRTTETDKLRGTEADMVIFEDPATIFKKDAFDYLYDTVLVPMVARWRTEQPSYERIILVGLTHGEA